MARTVRPGPVTDVVVVGASAGGVQALRALVARLPADLDAAVLVVLHIPPHAPSALASILDRAGPLPADPAVDGAPLANGVIVVAEADHHLLVRDGRVRLSGGTREHGHRPALDPLFASAAREFGPRAIGVVLSGNQDDGSKGLREIVECGGTGLVQDPEDAAYADMPRNALDRVPEARALSAPDLGDAIADLVAAAAPAGPRRGGGPVG
jgi:two-component system, chemotaxis family, protein-glutamate methylesterase/glutaminase